MTTTAPTLAEIASCIAGYDPKALPVEQAREFIARLAPTVEAIEKVALRSALGRVLGADVVSPIDVPAADNSAMDGYALRGAELAVDGDSTFAVAGSGFAGDRFEGVVGAGECVRIMTGAVMPAGLDTVVPQEFVRTAGVAKGGADAGSATSAGDTAGARSTRISVPAGVVGTGGNRRLAGEDLRRGAVALRRGRVLKPADLGMLASLGLVEVPVRRRLRVAFFSTGNELRSLGEPLDDGCVYDSNRYTLWAMLERLGVDAIDLGVVADDRDALAAAFATAARDADAVVTSGGVSVGEADHTKDVMASLGEVLFWRIAMRPGRPMAIGRIESAGHSAILFGLPGNPVAVMVTFYALVRDALLAMAGAAAAPLLTVRARSVERIRKRAGRTEYQRGVVARAADGRWEVRITGSQGSGILSSMSEANGLVVLGHDQLDVAAGDEVEVVPFEALV